LHSDSHFEPYGVPPLGGPCGQAAENRLKAELHTKSDSANNQNELLLIAALGLTHRGAQECNSFHDTKGF
jgi:hypothetical protein